MSNKPNFTDFCRKVAEKNCKDLPYKVYESPSALMQQAAELYADRRVEEAMKAHNEELIAFAQWCDTSETAYKFWNRNKIIPTMEGNHHALYKSKMQELLQIWKEEIPKPTIQ